MSEQFTPRFENQNTLNDSVEEIRNVEIVDSEQSKAKDKPETRPDIDKIQQRIEEAAKAASEIKLDSNVSGTSSQPVSANRELKDLALQRILSRTRKHLSAPDKLLSRFIHASPVDLVSRGAEKVARPIGLLVAGIFALTGSAILLYTSKHYGFSYNFSALIWLFAIGLILGLLLEMSMALLKKRRS